VETISLELELPTLSVGVSSLTLSQLKLMMFQPRLHQLQQQFKISMLTSLGVFHQLTTVHQ